MEIRLPEDKRYRLRQMLIQTLHRKKIQLKELESLIVKNFAPWLKPQPTTEPEHLLII